MYNYENAYRLTSEFLKNLDVKRYWREPEKLFKAMNWELIPYNSSDRNNYPGLSTDAYSSYKDGKFFILYYKEQFQTRTNYNLHHEAGHIVAGHPIIYGNTLCKSSLTTENKYLETEATIIGRNIFFPAKIVDYIIKNSRNIELEDIKSYFVYKYNLSYQYVNTRFDFLEEDLKNMVYPEWIHLEEVKEYNRFSLWYLKNRYKPFIQKYIEEYKNSPTKLMGRYSFSIPLTEFEFSHTDRISYGELSGDYLVSEHINEYTGICSNLEKYNLSLKNKIAILKVYEYPIGEVNQVLDIELIEK